MAAAMANVDDRDNWKVHFADTMRGGQYLNNWRMAELHAQGSPRPRARARGLGRRVRPHPDGRILQRNFGGHRYPRLAHVGDRTGLEMIRTLQDHGDPPGGRRAHGVHGHRTAAEDGDRVAGALAYDRERGRFHTCSRPRRSSWPPAASAAPSSHERTLGVHRRRPRAGLRRRRRAHRHGVRAVPPHGDGVAAERARHPRHRGRARRRRRAANSDGKRFMFDDIPELQAADGRTRGEAGATRRATRTARRPPELLTRDHVARCINARGQGGPRQRRTAASSSTSRGSRSGCRTRGDIKKKLPSMYHQFKELADLDITKDADGGRPDHALHHGRHPRDRDTQMSTVPGLFAAGECGGAARRQPARRQLALRPARLRQAGRGIRGGRHARSRAPRIDKAAVERRWARPWRRSSARAPENPYKVQHDLQEMMQDWSASYATPPRWRKRSAGWRRSRAGGPGRRRRATASTTRAGTPPRPAQPARRVRGDHAAALERRESRGGHFRDDYPDKEAEFGACNILTRRGPDGGMAVSRVECRRCRRSWRR
jgi:succinate dehydrogenase / fumarate reductase flavoprotein subunit